MKEFILPVRVYYEDTDTGGVVYYANYLKFMERARTEWLRARGIEQDILIHKHDIIFAVRSVKVDYLKPARFNQLLNVSAEVAKPGKASVTFEQKITPADDGNTILCVGQIKVACLQASTLRPTPVPADINTEIMSGN